MREIPKPLKEHSLQTHDNIDGWVINDHLANGCIYVCHPEGEPENYYIFKLREPTHGGGIMPEVGILKRIEEAGGHPSFQNLVDYNNDPDRWYLVLSPVLWPHQQFFGMQERALSKIDPMPFITDFFHALAFACSVGLDISVFDEDHFFVKDGRPFFLGLAEENVQQEPIKKEFNMVVLYRILDKLFRAAEYRGATRPTVVATRDMIQYMDCKFKFEMTTD